MDVDIDVYLDDFTLTARGKNSKVERDITRATKDTMDLIKDQLGAEVAKKKTTLTCNTKKTAEKIAKNLGQGVQAHSANTMLGCDLTQGARWKHRVSRRKKGEDPARSRQSWPCRAQTPSKTRP